MFSLLKCLKLDTFRKSTIQYLSGNIEFLTLEIVQFF